VYISTSTPSKYIRDIAVKYDTPIVVSSQKSSSLNDCNFALRNAKTKYITLAHQDDIYLPQYAEQCVNAAEKYKDTLICFTNSSEIFAGQNRPDSAITRVKRLMFAVFMPFKKNMTSRFWKMRLLSIGNPISAPTVMFNLETLPNFQFESTFSDNLDWDNWCKMAAMNGRFVYLSDVLIKRRIHEESATSLGLEQKTSEEEDLRMFKRFWPGFIAKLLTRVYSTRARSNKI
jgi:hypothetical protein